MTKLERHSRPRLAEFLLARRDDIVACWAQGVRALAPACELSSRVLVDHVPEILERIAHVIGTQAESGAVSRGGGPGAHAVQRLGRGYNLEEVIKEYTLLRRCILDLWAQEAGPTVDIAEIKGLEDALDECITESATRFARERERILGALDEIAEAAFSSGNAQDLFTRLLQATVDALEVVDMVAILLRDGDVLHVRAAAGIEEAAVRGATIRVGEGFSGTVAAEGRPLFVKDAAQDPFVELEGVRKAGMRALYGVPLIAKGEVLGVAQMGSLSAFEFSEDDKLLFETMASRALLVIQSALLQSRLRESSARNAAILDTALDCIISMDSAGRVVGWNQSAERTFGYSRGEALGAELAGLIVPPRYRAAHRGGLERYLADGRQEYLDRRIEISALRRDGSEFPVELTITRVAGEQPLFTGFVRDITREKQAEGERLRLVEEVTRAADVQRFLSDSSKQLAATLDYEGTLAIIAHLAVPWIADWCAVDILEDGQLRRVSVAHVDPRKEAFVQELVTRYPPDPGAAHGPSRVVRTGHTEFLSEIPDALLAQSARDEEHLSLLRTLGLKSYISTPVCLRGTALGAITFVNAESGRRYTEADLPLAEELALRVATAMENARLYREAQAAVRMREDVLAVVSHDLRNPLGTISLSASALAMMLTLPADEAQQRKQIDVILRATDRMTHLIGDLLDMASIQARQLSIEPRAEKLFPLLCEAFETHEPVARQAGITLRRDFTDLGLEVLCDHDRLIQALSNLLGNAVKFCAAGDEITLAGAPADGGEVLVSVADTGPGIPGEEIEEIFKPYRSVKRQGTGGTGLGLFITQGIVEAHGGRLWVESEPGAGTTFFFTLPEA